MDDTQEFPFMVVRSHDLSPFLVQLVMGTKAWLHGGCGKNVRSALIQSPKLIRPGTCDCLGRLDFESRAC